jgi:hypothetical protein
MKRFLNLIHYYDYQVYVGNAGALVRSDPPH